MTRRLLRRATPVGALAALLLVGWAGATAEEVGDVLPFRIVHGRPSPEAAPTLASLWSEGGRLKLRLHPRSEDQRIEGELRMSAGGVFKDVRPLSENLRVRLPTPDTLHFDVRMNGRAEGFDILLSGDFSTLTVDLRVDGERLPEELAIGERADRPAGLPAQLDLEEHSAAWVERFRFR